jgi:predicted DNA-binding transcriptional regulator YafY
LREHLVLQMTFADPGGPETKRRIRPLQLEFWGKVWTLTAWCEWRGDFRVFRIDRILSLAPAGGAFLPEPGKTIEAYLARFDTT